MKSSQVSLDVYTSGFCQCAGNWGNCTRRNGIKVRIIRASMPKPASSAQISHFSLSILGALGARNSSGLSMPTPKTAGNIPNDPISQKLFGAMGQKLSANGVQQDIRHIIWLYLRIVSLQKFQVQTKNAVMRLWFNIILIQLMNVYVIFTLKSFFPPMGPASASCSLNWALVVLKRRLLGSFSNCCTKRAANGLQANVAVAEDISHSNVAKCCAPKSGRMAWGPGCWMPKGRKNILRAACFVLLTTCCCDVVMIQMVIWCGDIYTVPRISAHP